MVLHSADMKVVQLAAKMAALTEMSMVVQKVCTTEFERVVRLAEAMDLKMVAMKVFGEVVG